MAGLRWCKPAASPQDDSPLLPALAYLTGDFSLLRDDLRPDPVLFSLPGAGFSADQAAAIRAVALDALIRFRDGGCRPAPVPADDEVLRIMEFAVGGSGMAPYLPLLEEELAHRGEDRRAPTWRKGDLAPDVGFRVAVIGAGMSGLLVAHRLQLAHGSSIERGADLGAAILAAVAVP